MGNHRAGKLFLTLLVLLVSASGCQSLHPQQPVDVQVRDAETKKPIESAQVRVWHSADHAVTTTGTTGPDGMAHVPAPPAADSPYFYEVKARGYLQRPAELPVERTTTGAIVELFAGPEPTLELVIPTGFRGAVKATIRVQKDLPYQPGQRLFSFPVSAIGVVDAVLPPIFTPGTTPNIRMRYQDGTPLERNAKDFDIGCRWLKSDPESAYIFVVGTQWEADEIRRALQKAAVVSGLTGPTPAIASPASKKQ